MVSFVHRDCGVDGFCARAAMVGRGVLGEDGANEALWGAACGKDPDAVRAPTARTGNIAITLLPVGNVELGGSRLPGRVTLPSGGTECPVRQRRRATRPRAAARSGRGARWAGLSPAAQAAFMSMNGPVWTLPRLTLT